MRIKNGSNTGIKEIARRANVSIGTVDRVIHQRGGVSPHTRDKIRKIIKDLNYQPNLLAQRLASHKTIQLAVLIPKVSEETSFWEAPLRGIEKAESEIRHYGIKVEKYFFDQDDKNSFSMEGQKLLKKKPDGILLAPNFMEEAIVFINECKKLKIPYVFIDSNIPNQDSLSYFGPNLYHSGYLAGNMISYLIREGERVLIVNISKEMDNFRQLFRIEDGFRSYFRDHKSPVDIEKLDIDKIDYLSVKQKLIKELDKSKNIRVIFVTNSKVSIVARCLEESKKDILLVGYDFVQENIKYLERGIINFLICQKPFEQAYKGIMTLYQTLVLSVDVKKTQFMPIDILTKENYPFYDESSTVILRTFHE